MKRAWLLLGLLACTPDTGPNGNTTPSFAAAVAPVTFVGAGDIASCSSSGDDATANLLDGIAGTVFTAGDNAYTSGSTSEFANCYNPTWGRHKARTKPSPGNHDYGTSGATGYFAYYGSNAGPSGRGYYSYDLGAWHLISLNSNVSMSATSPQAVWLKADLNGRTGQCVLAYWHHPRFASGTTHGSSTSSQPIWQILYDSSADVVLSGHEHNYERFDPQTPAGVLDNARGIREFIVGTGGVSHYSGVRSPRIANSVVFNGTTWGVTKFTLSDGSYSWQFIPVSGQSFTDAGSANCHGAGGPPPPPPPPPTLKSIGLTPSSVTLDTSASQQFTARDTMSDGTTKTFAGTWTATGGTVSSSGLYKAGKVDGSYRVIAAEGGKADTSAVTVKANSPPPPPPPPPPGGKATHVTLTPADTLRLRVGQTGTFTAHALDASNAEVTTNIHWFISGSTVASLAPLACNSPCSATVTAKKAGTTKVIIHQYANPSFAPPDTAWVKVSP